MSKNLINLLITLLLFGTVFYIVFSRFKKQGSISTSKSSQVSTQDRLYNLMYGDIEASHRLVQMAKRKKPGMSEQWYWEKAIDDLMSDRR